MERFKKNDVSHGFSRIELFVIFLVVVLALFIAFPKAKNALSNVKRNGAIESAVSYKESVNNYYVSQLMFDNEFKLNGVYRITDGNLVNDGSIYNIRILGNIPSDGYLDYENNILKEGCIVVNGYAVNVLDGEVVSATQGTCEIPNMDVAFGL